MKKTDHITDFMKMCDIDDDYTYRVTSTEEYFDKTQSLCRDFNIGVSVETLELYHATSLLGEPRDIINDTLSRITKEVFAYGNTVPIVPGNDPDDTLLYLYETELDHVRVFPYPLHFHVFGNTRFFSPGPTVLLAERRQYDPCTVVIMEQFAKTLPIENQVPFGLHHGITLHAKPVPGNVFHRYITYDLAHRATTRTATYEDGRVYVDGLMIYEKVSGEFFVAGT